VKVSFITALYNRLDLTASFVHSLGPSLPPGLDYEVLLLDAGSTDGTREFISGLDLPNFRAILSPDRGTYAEMNNLGADEATGDILCLINNDTVLKPGWLEPMLRIVTGPDAQRVGIIGNVQWNPFTRLYDHMGVLFSSKGPSHFGYGFPLKPFVGCAPWKVVTGACCVLRRDLFLDIGKFDRQFVNGSEDVDLCLRLEEAGRTNVMCYDSVIGHYVSSSPGRHQRDRENQELFLKKWSPARVEALAREDADWCEAQYETNHVFKCAYRPWQYKLSTLQRFFGHAFPKLAAHGMKAMRRRI
jgi:GT2 family glycosyltransferase